MRVDRAGTVVRIVLASLLTGVAGASSKALAGECLAYDSPVTLEGTLTIKTFPGRPNYQSVEEGDEPETVLLLQLKKPICLIATADGLGDAAQGVRKVQLALHGNGQFAEMKRLLGKAVRLSGLLFGAISGHHHTPALMERVTLVRSN
ncbi:DUF4431 domain-containing protein [Microvirga puerhi]|uniref:DUF4431 domain-containing protein n=1 Tax=Microvirga puerhi TaxID=2876078 RepID=A0ABS7VPJ6_9HYPH|nr:DUF4431 domain-containing protein [Microvirga puerhi]MBZ6077488.1 DUF4431 domain-containing protein [Microvirga puerhi]